MLLHISLSLSQHILDIMTNIIVLILLHFFLYFQLNTRKIRSVFDLNFTGLVHFKRKTAGAL